MMKQMMDRGARTQAAKEDEMRKGFLKSVSKLNFEALAMFNKKDVGVERVAEAAVDERVRHASPSPVREVRNPLVHRHQYK
jgi:hypothetical protein